VSRVKKQNQTPMKIVRGFLFKYILYFTLHFFIFAVLTTKNNGDLRRRSFIYVLHLNIGYEIPFCVLNCLGYINNKTSSLYGSIKIDRLHIDLTQKLTKENKNIKFNISTYSIT
jgi:hypothetical protein